MISGYIKNNILLIWFYVLTLFGRIELLLTKIKCIALPFGSALHDQPCPRRFSTSPIPQILRISSRLNLHRSYSTSSSHKFLGRPLLVLCWVPILHPHGGGGDCFASEDNFSLRMPSNTSLINSRITTRQSLFYSVVFSYPGERGKLLLWLLYLGREYKVLRGVITTLIDS